VSFNRLLSNCGSKNQLLDQYFKKEEEEEEEEEEKEKERKEKEVSSTAMSCQLHDNCITVY
jgi:hypothetical protein